jgi:hypothetical protein
MTTDDFLRPTRAEADRDAHEDRLDAEARTRRFQAEAAPTSIRCAHCKGRHGSAAEVAACADSEAEALAELAWEANGERAYSEALEARAERGTWFGPVTEADSWGEEDDAAPVSYAVAAGYTGECEYGRCDVYTRCIKHREQDAARGVKDAMFRAYND